MESDASRPTIPPDGRLLRLFLVDGSPTGLITAELGNWAGQAVAAPRAELKKLIDRIDQEETRRTGIYLLMGAETDDSEADADAESFAPTRVYVGESVAVHKRLAEHNRDEDKQFFDRVCVFFSKDDNLTKGHVQYLEARIIGLVGKAARVVLENDHRPDFAGILPEADMCDMEQFLSEIRTLLPVLGFDILSSATADKLGSSTEDQSASVAHDSAKIYFVLKQGGADARAISSEGGKFLVLADSRTRAGSPVASTPARAKNQRNLLICGKILKKDDAGHYTFMEDVEFKTPSAAA